MRVLVMGAGGVGGFYGGILALSGHDVTFVARGAHLAAMRERGLEIRTGGQTKRLRPVSLAESPGEAARRQPFDLVLFTVKTYDTEAAARAVQGILAPDTAVLTLQNGVDSVEQLSALLGADHVLAGATQIETTILEPGVIDQRSPFRKVWLGEPSGEITPRVEAIAGGLQEAGAEVTVSPDPTLAIWEKFVRLTPNATLTTACGAPVGQIRDTPEGAALLRTLVSEVVGVGRGSGVALPEDAVESAMETLMSLPDTMGTSMQRDFERRSRVELEHLTGAVVRRGRDLGLPTPAFEAMYAILKVRALSFGGIS
jgi:2-dehydropantoate 2-reductase